MLTLFDAIRVDLDVAYAAMTLLWAAGLLIASLEQLFGWRRYLPAGTYSWRILGSRAWLHRHPRAARVVAALLDWPGIVVLCAVQAIALAVILATPNDALVSRIAVCFVAAFLLTLHFRNGFGDDGADQMSAVIALPLVFHALVPASRTIAFAGLLFVGAQACLSYLASGISKAVSPIWRSGRAIFGIMNTRSYGSARMAALLRDRPHLNRALAWSVFGIEALFPLVLFAPQPIALALLAWGVSFHLFCAGAMGLNSFVWAFTATYPALLHLRGLLG